MNSVLPIATVDGLKMDPKRARAVGEELSSAYCFAEPFPHIVLDNFLPETVARQALEHFPKARLQSDVLFEIGYAGQNKRQILPEDCDGAAREMFNFFNSQPMIEFLEGLTAIDGLIPDPHFAGGGFHETTRGGKLGIHADFRINDKLHVHRRLNVIIYLNENWSDEYGGQLELWDRKMTAKVHAVSPLFNRCVIFNTDADSYHGHPDPLTAPEGISRKSIALYYYTASHAIHHEVPSVSTMYQARPGDSAETKREARALRFDQHLRQWVPPALLRYVYAVKRRLAR
ncbi:2OG-Fe(II) oxygenase [Sphaerotilaceae bacterium SBD11-9]